MAVGGIPAALAFWHAIARQTHFTEVLKIIGSAMAERATDRRFGREARRSLCSASSSKASTHFERAVPNVRIQQMLRRLDDEVGASAANAIQQFVRDLSVKANGKGPQVDHERSDTASSAALFCSAAAPFLREVWPQEPSLVTPGVSGALADLPAASGEAFAEAVDTITRFPVPFDCWSTLEYGSLTKRLGKKLATIIDDELKAKG